MIRAYLDALRRLVALRRMLAESIDPDDFAACRREIATQATVCRALLLDGAAHA